MTFDSLGLKPQILSALKEQGYEILGVSPDTEKKHQKFIDKYNLTFDLLADTEKETEK